MDTAPEGEVSWLATVDACDIGALSAHIRAADKSVTNEFLKKCGSHGIHLDFDILRTKKLCDGLGVLALELLAARNVEILRSALKMLETVLDARDVMPYFESLAQIDRVFFHGWVPSSELTQTLKGIIRKSSHQFQAATLSLFFAAIRLQHAFANKASIEKARIYRAIAITRHFMKLIKDMLYEFLFCCNTSI